MFCGASDKHDDWVFGFGREGEKRCSADNGSYVLRVTVCNDARALERKLWERDNKRNNDGCWHVRGLGEYRN